MSTLSRLKAMIGTRSPIRLGWHKAKAFAAALRYGFPARKLTVIGVTGTDGKTTTVGMTAHILREAGLAVGALSTAYVRINDELRINQSQKTSPSPFIVQRLLKKIADAGCTHAVLEFSSHGLVQGRTDYTWPAVAAITNTAMEHLDYHGTMEQYRKDKGILFEMLRGKGVKVLNVRDETHALYQRIPSDKTIVYGVTDAIDRDHANMHLWAADVRCTPVETSATINGEHALTMPIPGAFNVDNALCAIGCAAAVGVEIDEAVQALSTFRGTPGRMERIDEGQSFSVFIDFAITPQAFEKTLTTVRSMIEPGKRVIVLTGSCGDRMREKRPLIGELCSRLADVVVITDDESYAEDPVKVLEEVWAGVDETKGLSRKIFDRREAMTFALREAKPGDAVVLCGLGSYPSRMTPKGPIPWNEQEITRGILRSMR